jgi:glycosyltransferase involved in cell wall biosynthesis
VFIDWFLPGTNAGGPIRSVYSMVKILQKDFDFKIFTRNTDHNSTLPYKDIQADTWIKFDDHTEVFYCSEKNLSKQKIKFIIESVKADKIYINSFYSPWFSIYPLQLIKKLGLQKKVVLAPRGMLGKGALSIKPVKKKLFIAFAKLRGLHTGITWQASSENEKNDIVKVFGGGILLKIAGNLSYIEQLKFENKPKQENELKLYFLSRIVPIKNLYVAIEALRKVDQKNKIVFDVFGPVEDKAYWNKCMAVFSTFQSNIKVEYKGVVKAADVQDISNNYHALYMPTLNENFGHSILEAFAAGCPAIISDQTPWNNLESQGMGYNIKVYEKNVQDELARAVNEMAGLDLVNYNLLALKAWGFAHFYLTNNATVQANKSLFDK